VIPLLSGPLARRRPQSVRRSGAGGYGKGCSAGRRSAMDKQGEYRELLTRLKNIRDAMEEALGDVRGVEDDYRRGLLEAHIKGAIREINAQITEVVSSIRRQ
jgi:hypothetical protein